MPPTSNTTPNRRSFSATDGARTATPIMLGYLGIGFASGAINAAAGLSPMEVLSLSLILFTGSAQFVFAELYTAQPAVLVGTIFLLNFRHFLYSTAFVPYARRLSTPARFLIGAQLTDESFALATTVLQSPIEKARWMIALNMSAYLSWAFANTLGAAIGGIGNVAKWLGIEFALAAMFAGLLMLLIQAATKRAAPITVAVVAAAVMAGLELWHGHPANILIAATIAASVGVIVSTRQSDLGQ